MLALYVFAFGVVFGGRFTDSADESTLDYALGVFLGLSVLGLISGTIGSAPGIIVSQPNFVKKVVFPLEVLPAASVGALAYDLIIGLALCFGGIAFFGPGLSFSSLYTIVILGPVFLIGLGLGWFFCGIGSFYSRYQSTGFLPRTCLTLFEWCFLLSRESKEYRSWNMGFSSMESLASNH